MGKMRQKPIFPIFLTVFLRLIVFFSISLQSKPKQTTANILFSFMATYHLKERTRELVAAFCAGNDHAFAQLYDLYIQMLFSYGKKLTQDEELLKDCIHDVFVKVYSKRQEKSAINNLGSYLVISLKNRLLDEFRRQTFTTDDAVEDYESRQSTDDVEHDYLFRERENMQQSKVSYLMQNLTKRQRQAITLYYLEERKYDEICDIMQMNYHSVRNLMHRGMLKLREAAL